MRRHRELVAVNNQNNILRLTLEGMYPHEIAEQLGLSEATVNTHISKALEQAKGDYEEFSGRLLAKNYGRLDVLIERLTREVFESEDTLDLPKIDRLHKLIAEQNKMLLRDKPIKVKHSGDRENPIVIDPTFRYGSPEYNRILEIVQDNPDIIELDPSDSKIDSYLNFYDQVELQDSVE